jgi:hypothetical protein
MLMYHWEGDIRMKYGFTIGRATLGKNVDVTIGRAKLR